MSITELRCWDLEHAPAEYQSLAQAPWRDGWVVTLPISAPEMIVGYLMTCGVMAGSAVTRYDLDDGVVLIGTPGPQPTN